MGPQSMPKGATATLVAIAAGVAGYLLGTSAGGNADWRTGTARVMGEPTSPDVVITDESGWDYATAGGVDWIDGEGFVHIGDRMPDCLKVLPLTHRDYGGARVIRFATVDVDAEGVGSSRMVVAIDCGDVT